MIMWLCVLLMKRKWFTVSIILLKVKSYLPILHYFNICEPIDDFNLGPDIQIVDILVRNNMVW